jgi:hypothetical protein
LRKTERLSAFFLALFTALGFILELFVVEKELFAGGKDEFVTAIHALQVSILEFHFRSPPPRDGLTFILGRRTDGTAIRKLGGRPFNRDPPRKN